MATHVRPWFKKGGQETTTATTATTAATHLLNGFPLLYIGDILQAFHVGAQPTVQDKDSVVNQGGNRQVVEGLSGTRQFNSP